MQSDHYAAIDIGTNAVRLLIGRVRLQGSPRVEKELLVRIPLRLGNDVFTRRELSPNTIRQLTETITAFRHLMKVFRPRAMRACATSAMRESCNGAEVVREIEETTGIRLEIIDGQQEAELIFANRIDRQFFDHDAFLYVDVGGGSTELNLFIEGRQLASASFKIGGVRILNEAVPVEEWPRMQKWIREHCKGIKAVAIGSGGNVGRLHRMAMLDERLPLTRKKLDQLVTGLAALDVEERIREFKLKPDRADVIVPAGKIYLEVMKWADIRKIYVPKFGLADGLILNLYREYENIDSGVPYEDPPQKPGKPVLP
jgi:exopolyphosphatase/guanosine-5'-triphosphate,3'-diphosphate pyrophosphatase